MKTGLFEKHRSKQFNDTVGVILGVHPREHEIHEEVNKTIANITGENETTNNLTKNS